MRLKDKISLITGAAQGIGLAIAQEFLRQGATVFLTDIQDEKGAQEADLLGNKANYLHLDVRFEDDWRTVTNQIVDQCGRLDILVNNAGITGFENGIVSHDPENVSLEDWHAVLATNLDGVLLGCKYAIKTMKQSKTGSIINISSRSGIVGIPQAAAYAASKAAVRNHTKTVALYCAQMGWQIRCNSVHPAAIMTPMWETMLGDGEGRAEREAALVKDTPLKRFGMAEEVAHLVVYLASDESSYATGAEFTIDGGILAGSAASPGALED
ncbi:MAG TPA: glucose 1-dehydrogenase [Pyrinomonadaceae bacterium]|jgi:NAD(P)-dependent dehydrogenase (short-subunit alcohol dehydrogenase family)